MIFKQSLVKNYTFLILLALCFLLMTACDNPWIISILPDRSERGIDIFTVTYYPNGASEGEVPIDENEYHDGDTVTVLANTGNLVKEDDADIYIFDGWSTVAGNGTEYKAGDTFEITEDTSLYAIWKPVPVHGRSLSITEELHVFDDNPVGYTSISPLSVTVTNTGSQPIINYRTELSGTDEASFILEGTTNGTISVAESAEFTVKPNTDLIAGEYNAIVTVSCDDNPDAAFNVKFTVYNNFTVTYYGNESGNDTNAPADPNSPYREGTQVTVLNQGDLVKAGFTFTGWNEQADGLGTPHGANSSFSIHKNIQLYAQWQPIPQGISLNKDVHEFTDLPVSYAAGDRTPFTIEVTNTSVLPIPSLTISLGGTNSGSFNLSAASLTDIDAGGMKSLTVQPNTGLAAGNYSATVNMSGANGVSGYLTIHLIVYNTYTITYNGNGSTGGSVPVNYNKYREGTGYPVAGNTGSLVRVAAGVGGSDTYTFEGWKTASGGATADYPAVGGSGTNIQSNITLYAHWTLVPRHGMSVSQSTAHTFASLPFHNYTAGDRTPLTVTVTNAGNQPISNLTARLEGVQATSFDISTPAATVPVGTIATPGSTSFTVVPKTGLAEGTYTATVEITADNIPKAEFTVTFTVTPTYTVTYNSTLHTSGNVPAYPVYYNPGATITVSGNTGNLAILNHNFIGWNTAANGSGTSYTAGNTFNITANTILYAQWQSVGTPGGIEIEIDSGDNLNLSSGTVNLKYTNPNSKTTETITITNPSDYVIEWWYGGINGIKLGDGDSFTLDLNSTNPAHANYSSIGEHTITVTAKKGTVLSSAAFKLIVAF